MKRYRLGEIQPEWRGPVAGQPIIFGASDRKGFGVLEGGELKIYRLMWTTDPTPASVTLARAVPLGGSKVYALGPEGKLLAVPAGLTLDVDEEGRGPVGSLTVPDGNIVAVAFSASGTTLWAVVEREEDEAARLWAWDVETMQEVGNVEVLGLEGSIYELVVHPERERVGVDAAAGQDGSSFTFVDREDAGLKVLPGSYDGEDGVALGGLLADGALLITREATVVIDVLTQDRLVGPAEATLGFMKDEMIFDYQRGYIDDFWVLSGRFDNRDDDQEFAPEDAPEGRLRVYDTQLNEILEMPSTDDQYETPWAVVGLVGRRVLVCQSDALMLYNLRPFTVAEQWWRVAKRDDAV